MGWEEVVGFLAAMLVTPGFGAILPLGGGTWIFFYCIKHYRDGAMRNAQYNRLEYPKEIEQWILSFYYYRFEKIFIPNGRSDLVGHFLFQCRQAQDYRLLEVPSKRRRSQQMKGN